MSESSSLITKIGLSKLILWMEAERLESYPEAFSKLQAGREYTKTSLAQDTLGLIHANEKTGKYVREDFLHNLYGLDLTSPYKVGIRGINALTEARPGVYTPTSYTIEIGDAYRKKDETSWLRGLAQLIARYEVRTRLMLYLLGQGGYVLTFPKDQFFGPYSVQAEITTTGEKIALFVENGLGFNRLLQVHRWSALGPWWEYELASRNFEIAQNFQFEGLRDSSPSTNWLHTRLKVSLFLMKYLGVIECMSGGWMVNPSQAIAVLGDDIAQDFVKIEPGDSPIQRLRQWCDDLRDELGFVTISDLVEKWSEYKVLSISKSETEFDTWIRQQIYHGRVNILEIHPGQPRLGRGLYGNDNARKVRFEILEA